MSPAMLVKKKRDTAFREWLERKKKDEQAAKEKAAQQENNGGGKKRQLTLDLFAQPTKKQKLDVTSKVSAAQLETPGQ